MLDWMKGGGAEINKLKLRHYTEDNRGVHAARNIRKGEVILFIPKNLLITLDMAMASPIGSLMAARNFLTRLISPKHSFLATFCMEEVRKENSSFARVIDNFPKEFNNFPIFYTQEERQLLQGSPF
jgi:hypothetical protein